MHIPLFASARRNIGGLLQDFLGQQLASSQLNQIQCSANLMQAFHGLLQQTAIVAIGDELLEAKLSFLDGGKQFITHQIERRGARYHERLRLPRQ